MTSLTIPHVFEGNTPAIATDVNDNFSAVEEFAASINNDVSSLASDVESFSGDVESLQNGKGDISLNNLDGAGCGKLMMNTFCANSGNQGANGYADLVSYTGGVVSFKVDDGATYKPLVLTFTDGETKTLTSLDSIDMSALANGTYTFFVNKTGETLAKLTASVFIKDSQPATTNGNVWLDTSKTPYKSYVANGSNFDTAFDYVPLPVEVVLESGAVSSVVNGRYNDRTREILAGWGMPDYAAVVGKSTTGPWTADVDGFVTIIGGNQNPTAVIIYCNGIVVGKFNFWATGNGNSTVNFNVKKGDVVSYSTNVAEAYLYPFQGGI